MASVDMETFSPNIFGTNGDKGKHRAPVGTFSYGATAFDITGDIKIDAAAREAQERERRNQLQAQLLRDAGGDPLLAAANAASALAAAEEQGLLYSPNRLGDLFKPPLSILAQGPFDEVREDAQDENKWLLINVQTPTEFNCQRLNRDTWSDKTLRRIIKEHFIFWQVDRTVEEGEKFCAEYPVNSVPHIAIIDPHSGERLEMWEGFQEPLRMTCLLRDFLTADAVPHVPALSLDSSEVPPEPLSSSSGVVSPPTGRRQTLGELFEEEELMRAIQLSQLELDVKKGNTPDIRSPVLSRPSILTLSPTNSALPTARTPVLASSANSSSTATSAPKPLSSLRRMSAVSSQTNSPGTPKTPRLTSLKPSAGIFTLQAEVIPYRPPAPEEEATLVQIRMPARLGTLRQMFRPTDTVQHVYQFVASNWPGGNPPEFSLISTSPRRILDQSALTLTLIEAEMLNSTLVVEQHD
eukprot:TRINITY_DN2888_c0_g1_i1.p1 TRINITY_DN2888_c0_g1~~TRINITY_DN2888_c0_g1_i1.p1  ORF type:complete len:486 (+),score=135.25 TRINITY_DN2888_c0_g1_i1:60-1460(+)